MMENQNTRSDSCDYVKNNPVQEDEETTNPGTAANRSNIFKKTLHWISHITTSLRSWILKSNTTTVYKNEPIFGNTLVTLKTLCGKNVPEFVTQIIPLIEEIGRGELYRLNGNHILMQKVRHEINNKHFHVLENYRGQCDTLTGLHKMFFMELKESLIGLQDFHELLKIFDSESEKELTLRRIMVVINSMHEAHRDTLKTLLEHLIVVANKQTSCMTFEKISICWGPAIMGFADDDIDINEVVRIAHNKNRVLEGLLNIFNKNRSLLTLDKSEGADLQDTSRLIKKTIITEDLGDIAVKYSDKQASLRISFVPATSKLTYILESRDAGSR